MEIRFEYKGRRCRVYESKHESLGYWYELRPSEGWIYEAVVFGMTSSIYEYTGGQVTDCIGTVFEIPSTKEQLVVLGDFLYQEKSLDNGKRICEAMVDILEEYLDNPEAHPPYDCEYQE